MAEGREAGRRLLLLGNLGGTNVGQSLWRAAQQSGLEARLMEPREASEAPWPLKKFNWQLRGCRPTWLNSFSRRVLTAAREFRPRWLLGTGFLPLTSQSLVELRRLGVESRVFLTDDPWNKALCGPWLRRTLPFYDYVFSPRRANLEDLRALGCPRVKYLPFGYDEEHFYPESPAGPEAAEALRSDVVFAGGADRDRVPYFLALHQAGFKVALYGAYWSRFAGSRDLERGYASPSQIRQAVSAAKVALCLVRRANRDGHAMRTFEAPAMGACLLVEDTAEHRAIFGAEGEAALYFDGIPEMVEKTRRLVADETERRRLATAAHSLITGGNNTYASRLAEMLKAY